MGLLKRREVNSEIEEKVIVGMIVSDSFCRDISKIIDKNSFLVPFIAKISFWCKEYHKKYKQAPGLNIKDIFESEKEGMEDADIKAVSMLLTRLSNDNEVQEFNEEYLKDRALMYFRKRSITTAIAKAQSLTEIDKISDAEKVLESYRKTPLMTSKWINPFDMDVIKAHFADQSAKKNVLFELPGELGRFIGPFQRNWLVGFLAPTKRGKSFWLIEMAIQAAFQRKKVVFVSLEMSADRVLQRIYKRLTAMSDEAKDYIFPCFDCKKNQENSCNKAARKGRVRLLDPEGKKPSYNRESKYEPCTECRGKKEKDFAVETWFTTIRKEKSKPSQYIKSIKSGSSHFGKNLKIVAYPAFSANINHVRSDISALEDTEDFVPDLIVCDYADILAPEDARVTGRDRIDETWKTLKRMSDEIHCCVATASQSNRQSFSKKNVTQTDAAEDIRKISNSDLFLAINQTSLEKRNSMTRISKIAARDEDFDQYESITVLQQMALGQILLDSYPMKTEFVAVEEE